MLRGLRLQVLRKELLSRWTKIGDLVEGTLTIALDEAQVLADYLPESFQSPWSGEKRAIFSPFIEALLRIAPACDRHQVLVSGTGLRFLQIRPALISAIAKVGVQDVEAVQYTLARFSPWADVHEVQKFCESYLQLEPEQVADNAQYLLDKFRGRRRCLVSCVEHLIKEANGEWSKIEVDNFYNRLTNFTEKYNRISLYHQVHTMFITSKGQFEMGGLFFNAAGLLRRMGTFIAFFQRPVFSISSKNDMTLLECSLGRIERIIDEGTYEYVIEEPMVHAALLNYLERQNLVESSLKDLMATSRDDACSLGRLWEKLFTIHIPKLFDGTKDLAGMICFKGVTLPQFLHGKPRITGSGVGVWRESKEHGGSLSAFLSSDEQSRQQCFMFLDTFGPDILFLLRFSENLLIPCTCQLKF